MNTLQGYFKIDFCNLMTRIDGTAEKFCENVTEVQLQLSKKLVTIKVKDCDEGATYRFVKTLETDANWLLRATMIRCDGDTTYSLRFHDMKFKKHDVDLGHTITQSQVSGGGVFYDKRPIVHALQLSFGSYEIED